MVETKLGVGVDRERVEPTLEMIAKPVFTNIQPGMIIQDKYELTEHLGQGGMGTVYKARQLFEDSDDVQANDQPQSFENRPKYVAVKFLPPFEKEEAQMTEDERNYIQAMRKQFEIERKITVNLVHDNVVRAHDYGTYEGIPYFVLDYIEGYDLERFSSSLFRMNTTPILEHVVRDLSTLEETNAVRLPDPAIGFVGFCAGTALTDAHTHGLVHGDVSPDNIFIARNYGFIKLGDFGVARSQASIKREGRALVGKLPYMAPEIRSLSQDPDIRADIFSLGMTLYHMILGVSPNTPFNQNVYSSDQLTWIPYLSALDDYCGDIIPPHEVVEGVDERLSTIISKMIKLRPEERYQTPEELVRDLGKGFLYSGGYGITKEQFGKHIEYLENPQSYQTNPETTEKFFEQWLKFLKRPVSKRHQNWFERAIETYIPPLWQKVYGDNPVFQYKYFPEEKRRLTPTALKKVKAGLNPCRRMP